MSTTQRTQTPKWLNISISLFIIGLALLFIVSLGIQSSTGLVALDQPALQWLAHYRTDWLTTFNHIGTTLAGAEVLLVIAVVSAGVWYWRTKERFRPLLFVVSFGAAIVLGLLIKLCVARFRPTPDTMLPPLEFGYSLPSIHALGAAVFVLVLGYLLYSRRPSAGRLVIWLSTAFGVTFLAALTRLYLGYHWFSDIITSVGLALITLAVVILVDTYYLSRKKS
jgi:undecaprenyl-diphosphatase